MPTEILIIFLLLLLNGFFALSEIAIVSASKPLLRQYEKQGNKRAGTALQLAEDPGKFLSTVQVGITLVGILAGAYGGATLAEKITPFFDSIDFIRPHGETAAVIVIVSLITYFSVLIGELVPKQFALGKPEKIAMRVAYPMLMLSRACAPVVSLLEISAKILLLLLGQKNAGDAQVTEAEVKAVLSEGAEIGVIEKEEHDMLQRVIRLGDRDVKSIMTHRTDFVTVDLSDTIEDVRRKVYTEEHSRYPVTNGDPDNIIGVINVRELLDGALSSKNIILRDYVRDVPVIHDTLSCLQVMELFKKIDTHLALVVDEYGSVEGIVSDSDILEAIIGIMASNYDEDDQHMIVKRTDGSWLVDGLTSIDEIHLSIGLHEIATDDHFDTIAGFFLHSQSHPPKEGAVVQRFGHRFEVVDMDKRRIDKLLITRLEEMEE